MRCSLALTLLLLSLRAEDDYYKVLGIPRNASTTDIKSAFRKLSKKHHPDLDKQEGAADRFAKISEAYEVLTDEAKRRKYDKYGKEGLKEEGQRGDPFDFFGSFFGRGFRGEEEEQKAPPLLVRLHVSLEDVHNGRELSFLIFKKSTCFHCRGSGGDTPDAVTTCPVCRGRGVYLRTVQVAPGFVQQMQSQCPKCGGRGRVVSTTCHVCRGEKLLSDMDSFSVMIEKGAKFGSQLFARNAGGDHVDKSPADVVFELRERRHPFFRRKGDHDLQAVVPLSLREALLGFAKRIRHLDGRPVEVVCSGVTQPGHVEVLHGKGLPRAGSPLEFGDLFLEYRVALPASLSPAQKAQLEDFFKGYV